MQGVLNKNVVSRRRRERERKRVRGRERALQTSSFPTQPSSPDVYGLYKLLRAWECPPLWSEQQQCRSPDLSLPLSLSLSLSLSLFPSLSVCPDSLTVNPSRHTSSGDSWETELLLFSNGINHDHLGPFPHILKNSSPPSLLSVSHSLFYNCFFLLTPSRPCPQITTVVQFLLLFLFRSTADLLTILCLVTCLSHSLTLISFLPSLFYFPFSRLASLCVRGYSLSLSEVFLLCSISSTCGIKPTYMGAIKQTVRGPSLTD